MTDLALLKAAVDTLESQTRAARKRYHEALIEASGIKVDDVIEARFYSNEDFQPVIVRTVRVKYDKVAVTVSVKTKAGWSKAVRDARLLRLTDGQEVSGGW